MNVILSYTQPNNGGCSLKTETENKEEVFLRFLQIKLKYLIASISKAAINGYKHLRLPNFTPFVSWEVLQHLLYSKLPYQDMFKGCSISLSIHTPYFCRNFNNNLKYSIYDYFSNSEIITSYLGIDSLHYCMHLDRFNDFKLQDNFFHMLDTIPNLKNRLCFENDDRHSNVLDTLNLCKQFGVPFVFDNYHNVLNGNIDLTSVIEDLAGTWEHSELTPKLHYSGGDGITTQHLGHIIIDDLLNLLNIYKKYFDEIIVIVELPNARNQIKVFKMCTKYYLDWTSDYTFNI